MSAEQEIGERLCAMAKAVPEIGRRLTRLDRIEYAMRAIDDQDWDFLLSKLGNGGRDQFWKAVIGELRVALSQDK